MDTIEFDVDFAVVVVECEADVDDVAVFVFAFETDVFFELLLPALLGLSVLRSAVVRQFKSISIRT